MQHSSRKKTRKFLLQKLYARIYGTVPEWAFYDSYFEWILDFSVDSKYLDEMFGIIVRKQENILGIISSYAPKFDLDTMLKTNILAMCIAIAEMLYFSEEIPAKVSINEAIELSKYYGDDMSKNIVNGILNAFFSHIDKHQKTENIPETPFNFFTT